MRRALAACLGSLLVMATALIVAAAPAGPADVIAADDSYSKPAVLSTLSVSGPGVLANDQGVPTGAVAMLTEPVAAHGTVQLFENGGFVYTPGSDFAGTDSFGYCSSDDGIECLSSSAVGLVTIVTPVAVADSYVTRVGQPRTVVAPGVLANDQGSMPMDAQVMLWVPVSSGTLELFDSGAFNFTPASGFEGNATFDYCIGDGRDYCYSNVVTVTITVAEPVAVPDSYMVQHDRVLTVPHPGVLGNDLNVPPEGRLTLPSAPASGSLDTNPTVSGGFTYTPFPGFAGTDSFTYCVGDAASGCFTTRVAVTIEVLAGPAPPTNVSVHPGNNIIDVQFTPTPDPSVASYTATCTQNVGGDAGIVTTSATDNESPIRVIGVVNGVLASCTLHATNDSADGFESQPAVSTTPLESGSPGVPTNLVGSALPGQLSLSFAPPASDGGAPIYRYGADCSISTGTESTGIARVFGTGSPIVIDVPFDIPGFPPDDGLLVSCRLVAFNANGGSGFSEYSPQVRVFPADGPADQQPDGRIRQGTVFLGNDVYNMDASSQTATKSTKRLVTRPFEVRIQNDGATASSFRLRGGGPSSRFDVAYRTIDGAVITAAVIGATYATPVLDPGASFTLRIEVTPTADATIGSIREVNLTAISGALSDKVRARTQVVSG